MEKQDTLTQSKLSNIIFNQMIIDIKPDQVAKVCWLFQGAVETGNS